MNDPKTQDSSVVKMCFLLIVENLPIWAIFKAKASFYVELQEPTFGGLAALSFNFTWNLSSFTPSALANQERANTQSIGWKVNWFHKRNMKKVYTGMR